MQKFYGSNKGKENKNNISYKLREIKENKTKYQLNKNINNNSQSTITLNSIKKISKNQEKYRREELKDMLDRVSKNGVEFELAFEEFYDIMIKNIIPLNK